MREPRAIQIVVVLVGLLALLVAGAYIFIDREYARPTSGRAERSPASRTDRVNPLAGERARLDLVRVSGTVRDVDTGAGMGGAKLTFTGPADAVHVRTEAGGGYELSLAPGRYQARVAEADILVLQGGAWITLARGAGIQTLDILVRRLARVDGRVVDGDGEPLADIRVNAVAAADSDADPGPPVITDAAGRFSLAVPPGRVELAARAGAWPESRTTIRWAEPGARLTGVEIVMDTGVSVSGRVLDPAGRAIAGALVLGYNEDLAEIRQARSDQQGDFQLSALAPGRVVLQASAPEYAASSVVVVSLEPGASRSDITLVVEPARALSGRVVDDLGAPVAGAIVTAQPSMGRTAEVSAVSDGAGAFELRGLGAGPYAVSATAPELAPAVTPGVTPPARDLVITLARAGRITGRVSHAQGGAMSDFWVRLERNAGSLEPPGSAIPLLGTAQRFLAADGAYTLTGITPGRYDITFFAAGVAPETVRGVLVPVAGEARASVTLAPGASLRVTVTDAASGHPLRGAGVRLSTGSESPMAYTDAHGTALVSDIAPGRRSLEVSHPAYVERVESGIEVAPGRETALSVALERLAVGATATVEFAGIGAVLVMEQGSLTVRDLLPHGPAEVAGLQPGDQVTHIDGRATGDRGMAENIEDIRGVAGTVVRLGVTRASESFELDVVRGNVRFKPDEP